MNAVQFQERLQDLIEEAKKEISSDQLVGIMQFNIFINQYKRLKDVLDLDKRISEGEKRADIARSLGITEGALKTQVGRRRDEIKTQQRRLQ